MSQWQAELDMKSNLLNSEKGEILWSLEHSIMHMQLSLFPGQWLVAGPGMDILVYIYIYIYIYTDLFSNGAVSVLSYSLFYFIYPLDASLNL